MLIDVAAHLVRSSSSTRAPVKTQRTQKDSTLFTDDLFGLAGETTGQHARSYTRDNQGRLISLRAPQGSHYYLTDHIGSVVATTGPTGDITATGADLVVAGLGVEVLSGEAVGLAEVAGEVLGTPTPSAPTATHTLKATINIIDPTGRRGLTATTDAVLSLSLGYSDNSRGDEQAGRTRSGCCRRHGGAYTGTKSKCKFRPRRHFVWVPRVCHLLHRGGYR
jgi:hypothetical protein